MSCDTSQNFFYQLRKVARHVEQSVSELQKLSENRSEEYGHMIVAKKLLDLKKEGKKIKEDARGDMETLQRTGSKHEEVMQLCQSLIDIQKKKLTDIETYLQQYGYVHKPEDTSTARPSVEEDNQNEEDIKEDEKSVQTPPQKDTKTDKTCKTPRLEDFGISQMTLNMLAKADRHTNEQSSFNQRKQDKQYKIPRVPGIFEHDGLFMTPSVLGGKSSLQTPDHKHISEYASPSWTPMEDFQSQPNKTISQQQPCAKLNLFGKCDDRQGIATLKSDTNSDTGVAVNPSISQGPLFSGAVQESPLPPVFKTFGVKQIPHKSEAKQKKIVNFPKMQINNSNDDDSEPQPPELTISLSALSELTGIYNTAVPEPPKPLSVHSDTVSCYTGKSLHAEPEAPELTMNIKTLSEITGVYNTSIPEPPKPLSAGITSQYGCLDKEPEAPELTINFKDFKMRETISSPMPKGFKSLAEKLGHKRNENITPPMPEMLSERLERNSQSSDTTPKPFYAFSSTTNIPQPPKFLGQYNFMKKSDLQENIPP